MRSTVALDPNIKNLCYAVSSDGVAIEIQLPQILSVLNSEINKLKSKRDKCQKGSRRRERFNEILNTYYRKRKVVKQQAFRLIANKLFSEFDCVVIGDWTAKGGINRGMRRVINNETALSEFKSVLSWTAKKSGKYFHEVSERNTTRTCHICGHVVTGGISPKLREWTCPNSDCNTVHIRDENAAINILRRFTHGDILPRSGHFSITERCAWRVDASRIYVWLFRNLLQT